ncbi:hypothetical protein, partial [uncultured Chitinophaga sp.]|uniref:hypothetical protein n=1 Tax=uncultured Chitinophaga sp. TaxID=339340 RepID=UPI0025ECF378
MVKATPQTSSKKTISNNVDNIAGAGGGMVLLSLAQNLPDSNVFKSWLIILAPVLTLAIKSLWNICSPEISFIIKKFKTRKARINLLTRIDTLLKDPDISEEKKKMLRDKSEQVRLSVIDEL